MWSLFPTISSTNSQDSVRLLVGRECIVGRKDCAVLIKEDPSISRKHAVITVQHDISNLGDPSKIPEVMVVDKSKYGISVNGVKVTQPTRLKSGDEILFGNHHSCYRLTYTPLVVVTSCLDNTKKKPLKNQIHLLGGHLLNDWKSGCVTHLVMDGLLFTIKVIHALAECCSIVTPNMFDEIVQASETSSALPTPKKFLPPLKEESIKSDGPLFLPDDTRKTLFSGKTFIFLSNKQYKRTHAAIEMCGGETLLKYSVTDNVEDKKMFVKDGCCVMMVDQKERESYSMEMKQWITQIMDWMKSHDKRPIPESELGLAILQMTLTNYCNPDIDAVPALTQNIVCQSLNVGLDEMSQVFSPQHKAQANQKSFKKPRNPLKEEDDEKNPDIMFLGTTVAKPSSITNTAAEHHSSSQRGTRKTKKNTYEAFVLETQDNTPKAQKVRPDIKISPIPETLNISGRDTNVLAVETPIKETKEPSSLLPSTVEKKIVIPDSEGLHFSKTSGDLDENTNGMDGKMKETLMGKRSTSTSKLGFTPIKENKEPSSLLPSTVEKKIVIQDSEGLNFSKTSGDLDENTNGMDRKMKETLIGQGSTSTSKLGFIPDSMEMDCSPVTPREGYNSSRSSQDDNEESKGRPAKRTRVLDSTGDTERELEVIPTKRAKNEPVFESPEHVPNTEGYDSDEKRKESLEEEDGNTKEQQLENMDQFEENGDQLDVKPVIQSEERVDGFLSTKIIGRQIKTSPKTDVEDDVIPRNLVVVDVVSLLVRKPKGQQAAAPIQVTGKNFKKFRKQWYAGCERRFPKIIGGSDLVVHHAATGIDQEDWFIEAREANKEQDRRDKMEEELFMSDAGLPKRGKRRGR